jgi:hypothetical protein
LPSIPPVSLSIRSPHSVFRVRIFQTSFPDCPSEEAA